MSEPNTMIEGFFAPSELEAMCKIYDIVNSMKDRDIILLHIVTGTIIMERNLGEPELWVEGS